MSGNGFSPMLMPQTPRSYVIMRLISLTCVLVRLPPANHEPVAVRVVKCEERDAKPIYDTFGHGCAFLPDMNKRRIDIRGVDDDDRIRPKVELQPVIAGFIGLSQPVVVKQQMSAALHSNLRQAFENRI